MIAGLHAQEERFKRLDGTNVLLLRPVSFFENFYDALGMIQHEGINADSVAPDLAVPMIATRDIADVAAQALKARDWQRRRRARAARPARPELRRGHAHPRRAHRQAGSRSTSSSRTTTRPQALVQAGLSASFAGLYVEMTRAFNEGTVRPREGRTPENTTPTRFEDFADELARAYQAA